MKNRRAAWCAVLIWMATATALVAQDPTGAIEGTVTDPSGAVIASARVTVRQLDTGLTRETTSASNGQYRVVGLPVGPYSVVVEAPKLATAVREPIGVSVNQTVRLNVELGLSAVAERVTV